MDQSFVQNYVMTEYLLIDIMLEICFSQIRHEENFVGIYRFIYVVNKTLTNKNVTLVTVLTFKYHERAKETA